MSRNAFVALVNKRAGGNVGSSLLAKFKDELDEGRVYDLSDGGPLRALQEHSQTDNLRIIGIAPFFIVSGAVVLTYGIWQFASICNSQISIRSCKDKSIRAYLPFFSKDETICDDSS